MVRLKATHTLEMRHLEARVRTAVLAKDDAIAALRDQLRAALEQLHSTEIVLAAQQAELCE